MCPQYLIDILNKILLRLAFYLVCCVLHLVQLPHPLKRTSTLTRLDWTVLVLPCSWLCLAYIIQRLAGSWFPLPVVLEIHS